MKNHIIITAIISLLVLTASDSMSEISREKKQKIADKLYDIELSGGDHLGYSTEILQHLEKSAGIRPSRYQSNSFDDIDRLNLRGGDIDLYSLISGGLAIRESLQLESIRPSDESMRDTDPSALKSVDIESHPFEKMIAGRKWKIYQTDKYVPEDFYYIHFNSAAKAFHALNFINDTGSALHKRFSPASVDFMVREKLLTQLALRESEEFASFYSAAVSEIAITGSDPFVIEGSDVTLIMQPASAHAAAFNTAINSMRRYIRERYSAKEREVKVGEYRGIHLYSDDRRVWSVYLTLSDGTVVVSNSIKAAERVMDTFSGRRPPISDSPDYRYMRAVYPAGVENEDGFVYLSEKFIRHLVSPELRIGEARRMYEGMKISVLEKYMIFYFQLTGNLPRTIEEVMDSAGGPSLTDPRKKELDSLMKNAYYSAALKMEQGKLADWNSFRSALTSAPAKKTKSKKKKKQAYGPDDFVYDLKLFYKKITGQQAYTPAEVLGVIESVSKPGGLDSKRFTGLSIIPGSFSAKSDLYGKTGFMTPLIEIETGKVSRREAEEYKKFAENYNSFWRDYFDPIGIRIRTEPVFSVETCILPLINNSIYSLLTGISGGAPVELHPDSMVTGDTLSAAFKVNPMMISSLLTLTGMGNDYSLRSLPSPEEIFTGEVQFHMGDALPLADFDPAILSEFYEDNVIRSSEVMTGLIAWSLFHPVRIAIPVKRPKEGMIMVNSMIGRIIEKSNFNNYMQSESYTFTYNKTEIRVLKLTLFSSLITRFYIAAKDNVLHLTTTEKYMKEVIDAKRDIQPLPVKGNAVLVYRPSEMKLEKNIYRAGMLENGLQKSRRNSGTVNLMGIVFPDADSRDIPDLIYRNFGFKPLCPLGGEYVIDRKTGDITNSVYGSVNNPVLRIDENSRGLIPLYLKNFFKTDEIRVELEFTQDGIKTKILSR